MAGLPSTEQLRQIGALAKSKQPDRGALWKVENHGRTGYLYATVHVGRLEWLFPGPTVQRVFRDARATAFEVDLTDPALPARIREETRGMEAARASDLSGDERCALVSEISSLLAKAGIPERSLDGGLSFKEIQLDLNAATDIGLSPVFSIDIGLSAGAKATGKQIVALETVHDQAVAIYAPDSQVLARLKEFQAGDARADVIRITRDWETGDLQDLTTFLEELQRRNGETDTLIAPRNAPLAQSLADFFTKYDQGFAAVGIMHMVGTGGIVSRLREMGYTVTRVDFQKTTDGK